MNPHPVSRGQLEHHRHTATVRVPRLSITVRSESYIKSIFIEQKVAVMTTVCHTVPYKEVSPILWYSEHSVRRVVPGSLVDCYLVVDDDAG